MKIKKLILPLMVTSFFYLNASYGYVKEYKYIPPQKNHQQMMQALQNKNWKNVIENTHNLRLQHKNSIYAKDANYYEGLASFHLGDYAIANEHFSKYMQESLNPSFFEECITYKFEIAQAFREGRKKRLLKKMPRIASGYDLALEIYDEIIKTMPQSSMAAESMYAKGEILMKQKEYSESIQALQAFIQKFPKHELALDSYLQIAKAYYKQCNPRHQDVDLLDLAELNLTNFQLAFPKADEKMKEAHHLLAEMREIFAQGFFELGQFYEKQKKEQASLLYYSKVTKSFPNTNTAILAQKKLETIRKKA